MVDTVCSDGLPTFQRYCMETGHSPFRIRPVALVDIVLEFMNKLEKDMITLAWGPPDVSLD